MNTRCSAEQVAEAVLIRSASIWSTQVLCLEFEETAKLKSLDLFLSTLDVFRDAFATEIDSSFLNHYEELFLSKKTFIEYLKPRALILSEIRGEFELMLMCAYVSRLVRNRVYSHACFHFARTACELLNTIFQIRFQDIFEMDFGWRDLMSFCIKIHNAVFPLILHRPAESNSYADFKFNYDPFSMEVDEIKIAKAQLDEELDQKEVNNQNALESGDEGCTKYLISLPDFNPMYKHALDRANNIDYWDYYKLEDRDICERITYGKKHLDDVYNLLKNLGQELDSNRISCDIPDISLSDDEYAKQLERKLTIASFEISDEVKDCFAKEICEQSNKNLTPETCHNRLSPVDITKEEVMKHIDGLILEESIDSYCALCEGRMNGFIEKLVENFHEKYSNAESVTDII